LQSLGSHFTTTYLCPAYWSHHFHSYKFYQAKSKLNQHHWIHKSIMKILNERESFLSNYEVAEHLKDIKKKYNWTFTQQDEEEQGRKRYNKRFTACGLDLEVITRDILAYVANNPNASIDSSTNFTELAKFLNQFDLMKVEKLQIINSLPRSMVHLYALVEECDQRFDEDSCESIIGKINELFPVEEEEGEEEEEVGEEAEAAVEETAQEETPLEVI
jgi:hypothetical protein